MNNPTPEQCYAVAKLLRPISNTHPLNMMEGSVKEVNVCGTYLCHGGAYYAAKGMIYSIGDYYETGADEMARDLGFKSTDDLEWWAVKNPLLWLNNNGNSMFAGRCAFINSKHPDGAETIADIADHWEMVGDAIKKYNETNFIR